MELWTIKNYKEPKILSQIEVNQSGQVEIDDGYLSYDIELEDTENSEFVELLNRCSKDESIWQQIIDGNLPSEQQAFFHELEELGMIGEGKNVQQEIVGRQNAIGNHIQEAVKAYQNSLNAQKALSQVEKALTQINRVLSGSNLDIENDILTEMNFFSRILAMQISSWKHLCPEALPASKNALDIILGNTDEILTSIPGFFPPEEIRRSLSSLIWALTRSVDDDSRAKLNEVPEITKDEHAINMGILAEKHALYSLEKLGTSKFLQGLDNPETQRTLACAGYAQEYYITDRFVDLIAPGLSKRLPRNLKKLLRRYYNEEIGHDAYELKTCIALGMKKEVLLSSVPSPFGQIICDLFSWLAHDEPLAYFSTISITEGLPGQRNPINAAVLNAELLPRDAKFGSKQHEDLNFKLFHQLLPRWFLSECGVVNVEQQTRTMQFYNTMLEVSFRAWEELHRFHIEMSVPINPTSIKAYVK